MQKLGSILGTLDKNFGHVLKLRDRWPAIAGDLLGQHCQPVRIRQATLEVLCDSPAFVQQIDLFATELLPRLNRACGLRLKRIDARFGYLPEPGVSPGSPRRKLDVLELDPADVARVSSPELRAILEGMLEDRAG
ncbi:MAG: hypothetical protein BWY87_01511 [Deltaproteobacteria bacterium ADurb.Bin510]|nr:MAG: hypothetical protein BWY87_01511 [Deltaproteobacteria bacterium ADurb.Bin510]